MAGSIQYKGGRLYPPGSRGRFWYWRGSVDGQRVEMSCQTGDREEARRFVRDTLENYRAAQRTRVQTFADVADMYMDARQSSKAERSFIARLTAVAGDIPIDQIRQSDMVPVIRTYYPDAAPATVNRQVLTPYASITHWASEMDLCPYKRVNKLKADDARRLPAPDELGGLLLSNTEAHKHALCALLVKQGWRLSEILALEPDDVNLTDGYFRVMVPKSGRIKSVPMATEVCASLANLDLSGRYVFPWRTRSGVYKWWKPLVARLGYPKVTPHQFRHSFAMAGRDLRMTDDDLLEIGTWFNRKSVASYTGTPSEHARSMLGQVGGRRRK